MNLKCPFYTPEEYFLGDAPENYVLGAFNPMDYIPVSTKPADNSLQTTSVSVNNLPSSTGPKSLSLAIIPPPSSPDIILFVGSPAAGKSTFYRNHLLPMGYFRINQDTLKTRDKCVAEATLLLQQNTPIVVGLTVI
jgi:bifunctional polynucleotide phosphatase/kinase